MRGATTTDRTNASGPERLPAGATLPDGSVLTFPAFRDCGCEECLRAYEAHQAGELRIPDEGGLPW